MSAFADSLLVYRDRLQKALDRLVDSGDSPERAEKIRLMIDEFDRTLPGFYTFRKVKSEPKEKKHDL